jgi:Flp pilus assembly protein TadG
MLAERERGSATVETVIIVPVLFLALLLVPATYHGVDAKLRLDEAAAQAARDATLATTPGAALAQADADVDADLDGLGAACSGITVDVQVGQLAPGSIVTVTLSCHTTAQGAGGLPLGAGWPIRATARSVVDQYVGS